MAETIGVKMKVEGESSYSKAMRDAAKNTKALDAELKLAEAQFKASGDAEKLMADRGKVLKEQLGEQEKAVEAAKNMLQQLASAGYEQNSTKVMQWRQKLAQAEQSVLEINQALANNEQGLDSAGKKYDSLGESMQGIAQDANTAKTNLNNVDSMASSLYGSLASIGSEMGWTGLSEGINSINQIIDKAIVKVAELAKKIWDAGVDATVWADALLTDASVYGIDQETLQRWQYASKFIDTSVETIAKSQMKLTNNMSSKSQEMALAFNQLGVSTRDISGELRSTDDVFWDVIAGLGRVENEAERDALANKVLGRSYAELKPLIEAGHEAWEEKASEAPIVSEENVKKLGEANDAIEEMEDWLNKLKLTTLAEMAPIIDQIAKAISAAAKSLKEYLESDEGQQALTRLQEAISGLIADFTDLDFGKIIEDASGGLTSIINSFASIFEDKEKIVGAFKAIGIAIAGMHLLGAAASAASLLANLKIIMGWGSAGAGASAAGAGAGAAGGGLISGVMGSTVAKVFGGAGAGIFTFFEPLIKQFKGAGDRQKAAEEVAEADEEVAKRAAELGHTMEEAESYIAGNIHEWGVTPEEAKQMYLKGGDGYDTPAAAPTETAKTINPEELDQYMHALEILQSISEGDQSGYAFDDLDPEWIKKAFPNSILADILNEHGSAENWLDSTFDEFSADYAEEATQTIVQDLMNQMNTQMQEKGMLVGQNTDQGLANGIDGYASVVVAAAQRLVDAVSGTIISGMEIGSPSKLMARYGEYIGEGLANGIAGTESLVAGATDSMLHGVTLRAPDASTTPYGQAAGDSVPGLLLAALSSMRVEIDGKQAGTIILPTIEDLMAEEVNSRRYA